MNKDKGWIWGVLVSIDQTVQVILAPILNKIFDVSEEHKFGNPDETLSSVFGKNMQRCKACNWVCRLLHKIDPNHCEKSIEHDE